MDIGSGGGAGAGAGGAGAGAGAGGVGGRLASLESRRGWAADMSARAVRSQHWRVPATAAAVARSGEGVRRSFRSGSGSGR